MTIQNDNLPQQQIAFTEHKALMVDYKFGLDTRKPVFGGLQTTQAQTGLCICAG